MLTKICRNQNQAYPLVMKTLLPKEQN